MPKAYTVKESIERNKQLNEIAKYLYEEYKDKDPELAKMIKNDISLMPPDALIVEEKQVKKLTIIASGVHVSLGTYKPGEIFEQKITITSSGRISWEGMRTLTKKEVSKGFLTKGVKVSEVKNIGKKTAKKLLEKANEVLLRYYIPEILVQDMIADCEPDRIIIEYDNGEVLKGRLEQLTCNLDEVLDLYDYLEQQTQIKKLLYFVG